MEKSYGYEKGKTYYCGYWCKKHTVIDIKDNGDIVSKWEDGQITVHATPLGKRYGDKEL